MQFSNTFAPSVSNLPQKTYKGVVAQMLFHNELIFKFFVRELASDVADVLSCRLRLFQKKKRSKICLQLLSVTLL